MFRSSLLMLTVALIIGGTGTVVALEPGDLAPEFSAVGIDGKQYSLASVSKQAELFVLCFTCNQCPVSVAYEDRFIEFSNDFADKGVRFIALNCNNRTENLAVMKERAEEKGFNFVYAFDKSGNAALGYEARVTPELFVIRQGKIVYHGAFDNKLNGPTRHFLEDAVEALLDGDLPLVAETQAFGCGIKRQK